MGDGSSDAWGNLSTSSVGTDRTILDMILFCYQHMGMGQN